MRFLLTFALMLAVTVGWMAVGDCAEPEPVTVPSPDELDFFERRIRPILVERCYECHSAKSKSLKGGLRLDHRAGLLAGGDTGPAVVPGKTDESPLVTAIRYDDADLQMPPNGKLAEREIRLLVEWVERGAPMPAANEPVTGVKPEIDWAAARDFWSFQASRQQALPPVSEPAWVQQKVDAFLLAELDRHELTPSPAADRQTLIRRAAFDLLGLPPTWDEVNEFVHDDSPDAYARLIDRLLASPHYGQRWGRYWLDHARYTDQTETWLDSTAHAYLYRDWVVRMLNDDLPYDQFVRRQLATDMLPDTGPEDLPALGFLALSPTYWKELKLAPEVIQTIVADEWEERIDAVGQTFLGLTLACARCHDHKFDPISQQDYYALAGVFASTRLADRPLVADDQVELVRQRQAKVAELTKQIETLSAMNLEGRKKNEIAEAQAQIAYLKLTTPNLGAPTANVVEDASLYILPDGPDKTKLEYKPGEAQNIALQIRGDPRHLGPVIPRRFLTVLSPDPPPPFQHGSGRLELADAIVGPGAPLASRVIVNRIWASHFGRGLVTTPSNFGAQGARPTHPELLDDLTARFIDNGWRIKWLHRELMLSSTYQQRSTGVPPQPINPQSEISNQQSLDPDNRWLWRMNRRRLEFEAWRDAMLAVNGHLDARFGGPSVDLGDASNRRRTLYGTVQRRELHEMLRMHDFPDPNNHSPQRESTTTPLQQLFVLNSPFMEQQSSDLAARIEREAPRDLDSRLRWASQALFGREPTVSQLGLAREFLSGPSDDQLAELWRQYAHVLLGSNQFLFID